MKAFLFVLAVSFLSLARANPALAQATGSGAATTLEKGKTVYAQNCAACHMVDGSGVPGLQPALAGDAVVKGDATTLIRVVIQGADGVLPESREHYANAMPAFDILNDEQIASLLTYLRHVYGGGASAVNPAQVTAVRAQAAKSQ